MRVRKHDPSAAAMASIERAAPDLLVTDVCMEGIDGLQLIEWTRRFDPRVVRARLRARAHPGNHPEHRARPEQRERAQRGHRDSERRGAVRRGVEVLVLRVRVVVRVVVGRGHRADVAFEVRGVAPTLRGSRGARVPAARVVFRVAPTLRGSRGARVPAPSFGGGLSLIHI